MINGEGIKKVRGGGKGSLEFNRGGSIGIVEEEEKGVMAGNMMRKK